jgi:hypothetical protein
VICVQVEKWDDLTATLKYGGGSDTENMRVIMVPLCSKCKARNVLCLC